MSEGRVRKHHYLPRFYLKQWVGPDGKLCEFALHHEQVKPHRKGLKGVGYEEDLYTLDLGPDQRADLFETGFLKRVDDRAAILLDRIVHGDTMLRSHSEVSALSRFLMSLFQRDPKTIKALKKRMRTDYDALVAKGRELAQGSPENVQIFEDFVAGDFRYGPGQALLTIFRNAMDNPMIGNILNYMTWRVANVSAGGINLMTSDRPVIIHDGGFSSPEAFVALPISPHKAMLGFSKAAKAYSLDAMPSAVLARRLNYEVVMQAQKYVYATGDCALRFVSAKLGKRPTPTIQEMLSRDVLSKAASAHERSGLYLRLAYEDGSSSLNKQAAQGAIA